ncbi:hypothetical protein L1887_56815 [Cichorium endivia]|nr:hypothetical protein L1887_56815 [Cichorium endivia]
MSSTTASSGSSSISLMSRCSNVLALLPSVMQLIYANCAQESADLFSICIRFHRSHSDQPNHILQFVILRHGVCSSLECPRPMSKMFSLDITSQVRMKMRRGCDRRWIERSWDLAVSLSNDE